MVHEIIVTQVSGNWHNGTINGVRFNAKVYDEPSEFGIDNGNVSKLWIEGIANYDRGWDIKPKTADGKKMVAELLQYFSTKEA